MRSTGRLLLSLAVAGAVLALLFTWGDVDPRTLADGLARVDRSLYFAALGSQALIYVARGARLRVLLDRGERPSPAVLTAASAAWILDSHVLPAKVGEGSLVLHLRRAGVPGAHGLAALVASRVLDVTLLVLSLAAVCLVLGLSGAYPDLGWAAPLGAALLVPGLLCAWAAARSDVVARAALAALRSVGLARTALGARLASFGERVRGALVSVRGARLAGAAAWSVPVWVGVLAVYVLLARAYGLDDLPLSGLVFGACLAVLGALAPLNGFLGFGLLDVGWVAGFTALGVPRELAAESALAFHLTYLFNVGVLGALGHATLVARSPRPA